MDIAKIRKKAQLKRVEKITEEKSSVRSVEPEEKNKVPYLPSADIPEFLSESKKNENEPVDLQDKLQCDKKTFIADKEHITTGYNFNESYKENEEIIELLVVNLFKEEFAFRVAEIEEIIRLQMITSIPAMPAYVLGITSLRGEIIPVIDLKVRLGLMFESCKSSNVNSSSYNYNEASMKLWHVPGDVSTPCPPIVKEEKDTGEEESRKKKILIISGPKGRIGALIDRVTGVIRFPFREVIEPPAHLAEDKLKFIEGIAVLDNRFISILRVAETMNIEIN